MALNPVSLGTGIQEAFVASGAVPGPQLAALSLAIATAIIAELKSNASVVPTLLVAPPTGGPVTGTGKIA